MTPLWSPSLIFRQTSCASSHVQQAMFRPFFPPRRFVTSGVPARLQMTLHGAAFFGIVYVAIMPTTVPQPDLGGHPFPKTPAKGPHHGDASALRASRRRRKVSDTYPMANSTAMLTTMFMGNVKGVCRAIPLSEASRG